MATIFTRKNKSGKVGYYGNITINGKRCRRYLGNSKKVAELELSKLEYNLRFNAFPNKKVSKSSRSIQQASISFLKDAELKGIGRGQINVLKGKLTALVDFLSGINKLYLSDISMNEANEYIVSRTKFRLANKYNSVSDDYFPKLKSATLNKDIQILKRFFSYCIDMEWIDRNPFRAIKPFRVKPNGQRYHFTSEQLDSIMENAGKFYDFYYLLLHTGIRCTDAFKLKPEHFDGKYLKMQMNKTGDFLHVPIPEHVLDVLQPRMGLCTLFAPLKSDRQRRNCVKNIQRLFEPDFVRKNNINLHTFRHTYAHNMLNKGVPKEVLQTLLGHRSIKTTEIYANWVRKEELERWV